jgi:hypothetical protein
VFFLNIYHKFILTDKWLIVFDSFSVSKKSKNLFFSSGLLQASQDMAGKANDFIYVVMKRHLCVEARLSALNAAILTSNGLIDRFSLWLPGCNRDFFTFPNTFDR